MLETNSVTQSSDENEAIDTINSIYGYVRAQRTHVNQFTGLLPLIEHFEGWYQALEEAWSKGVNFGVLSTRHIISITDANEARRQRDAINAVMGQKIPDDYNPSDKPQTPPGKPSDYGIEPEFNVTSALTFAGIALGGILLYKILQK